MGGWSAAIAFTKYTSEAFLGHHLHSHFWVTFCEIVFFLILSFSELRQNKLGNGGAWYTNR